MQATKSVDNSRIAAIDTLASVASIEELGVVRIADQVARVFIPLILLLAGATYVYWALQGAAAPIKYALAVLVVSCPCALSLAVPSAVSAAISALKKQGLLVRHSQV